MRRITAKEISGRGCKFCTDMRKQKPFESANYFALYCAHEKCPCRELDGYKRYDDFIRATTGELLE